MQVLASSSIPSTGELWVQVLVLLFLPYTHCLHDSTSLTVWNDHHDEDEFIFLAQISPKMQICVPSYLLSLSLIGGANHSDLVSLAYDNNPNSAVDHSASYWLQHKPQHRHSMSKHHFLIFLKTAFLLQLSPSQLITTPFGGRLRPKLQGSVFTFLTLCLHDGKIDPDSTSPHHRLSPWLEPQHLLLGLLQ